jgi:hypothetical protein
MFHRSSELESEQMRGTKENATNVFASIPKRLLYCTETFVSEECKKSEEQLQVVRGAPLFTRCY